MKNMAMFRRLSSLMHEENVSLIGILEGIRTFSAFLPIPVFSLYAFRFTDSGLMAGMALGVYGIAMIFSQILLGHLSDIIGRKKIAYLSAILFSLGNLISWHPFNILVLIFSRAIAGFGAMSSPLLALLNEQADRERRTIYMAAVGTFSGFGIAIGVIAGPWIMQYIGLSTLFLISAILGFISITPISMLKEHSVKSSARPALEINVPFVFSSFASSFLLFGSFFFLPLYWVSHAGGISYSTMILITLITAGILGIFISVRMGMKDSISTITLLLFAVSAIFMFSLWQFQILVATGFFIFALGYTMFEIAFIPLLLKDSYRNYGSLIGFFNSGRYAGEFLGSITIGYFLGTSRIFHHLIWFTLLIDALMVFSILLLNAQDLKYGNMFNMHN
ncbi:hypothetical protein DMB44_02535 [Thermoplasma sp. Kam2015]|nr:hypothetical protein DMB44_02535 [Thermoplasma sp. Kam2015]